MSIVWSGTTLTELERAVLNAEIKAGIERQEAQAPEEGEWGDLDTSRERGY